MADTHADTHSFRYHCFFTNGDFISAAYSFAQICMTSSSADAIVAIPQTAIQNNTKNGNLIKYGMINTHSPVSLFRHVCMDAKRLNFTAATR